MAKKDTDTTAADGAADKPATAVDATSAPSGSKRKEPVVIHGPDSFMDRVLPHIKKIAIAAVALFAVVGIFVGVRWLGNRRDARNTVHVNAALAIARTPIAPAVTPPATPPATPTDDKTYPSEKDRATAALAELQSAGGAGEKSALYTASLLIDAGKLDDAEKLYKAHAGDAGVDGVLAREGLGYVLEARAADAKDPAEQKKLLEQALDAFKQMQPDDKGPRHDYALYHQARILAQPQLGKGAEARAALEAALKASPHSEIKGDIEARLALLEAP